MLNFDFNEDFNFEISIINNLKEKVEKDMDFYFYIIKNEDEHKQIKDFIEKNKLYNKLFIFDNEITMEKFNKSLDKSRKSLIHSMQLHDIKYELTSSKEDLNIIKIASQIDENCSKIFHFLNKDEYKQLIVKGLDKSAYYILTDEENKKFSEKFYI